MFCLVFSGIKKRVFSWVKIFFYFAELNVKCVTLHCTHSAKRHLSRAFLLENNNNKGKHYIFGGGGGGCCVILSSFPFCILLVYVNVNFADYQTNSGSNGCERKWESLQFAELEVVKGQGKGCQKIFMGLGLPEKRRNCVRCVSRRFLENPGSFPFSWKFAKVFW